MNFLRKLLITKPVAFPKGEVSLQVSRDDVHPGDQCGHEAVFTFPGDIFFREAIMRIRDSRFLPCCWSGKAVWIAHGPAGPVSVIAYELGDIFVATPDDISLADYTARYGHHLPFTHTWDESASAVVKRILESESYKK